MFKEAAQKLFDKGEITKEELDAVNSMAEEDLTKVAISMEQVRNIITTVGLGALAGSVGAEAVRKTKQVIQGIGAYDEMKKKVPILEEYPDEQVKDYYNVVKTFSPKAATNPLVAGALVNKMIQFGGVDHKLVQDIANIEGQEKNIFFDLATAAAKSTMKPLGEESQGWSIDQGWHTANPYISMSPGDLI